jgi:hypothetical protein
VRNANAVSDAPWPDTILVRLFDVAADEEIALERGRSRRRGVLAGEPSPHIRAYTSWKGNPAGSLAGGLLVAQHGSEIGDVALTSSSPAGGCSMR